MMEDFFQQQYSTRPRKLDAVSLD